MTLTVSDPSGASSSDTTTVTVLNVAPTLGSVTGPLDPVPVGSVVMVAADFTDPGTQDTHSATAAWGDGSTGACTVEEEGGSGLVAGSHAYATPGIYSVELTITDDDEGADGKALQYVVVYDPRGGFATGGGWIDSPAGAFAPDPDLFGRANFGFVSKYQKGSTVPAGVTEFNFQAGDLNFHSDTYQWLVISGARAQFKGKGSINGGGSYGFLLTAIDGQVAGGGGVDKFRIKIWDLTSEGIIYDNEMSSDNASNPTTAICGGSIVVHKP
jgi:hypothetical protein